MFGCSWLPEILSDLYLSSSGGNRTATIPVTFLGFPLITSGRNFHLRTAVTAKDIFKGCPQMTRAEINLPFSSMVILTITSPVTRIFGSGGQVGVTRSTTKCSKLRPRQSFVLVLEFPTVFALPLDCATRENSMVAKRARSNVPFLL
jgi:hypothetical protein